MLGKSPGSFKLDAGIYVSFIGIDGSGKTSHAIHLFKNLSKVRVDSVCIRPEFLLIRCVPKALMRWASLHIFAGFKKRSSKHERLGEHQAKHLGFGVLRFMLTLPFLIYVWVTYFLIVKPQLSRHVVICDRYFYDWIYYLDRRQPSILIQLIPKPDLIFLLDIAIPQAFFRMHSEEDKKFSMDYYSSLREWYLALAKQCGFIVINSDQNFGKTKKVVFDRVISLL